MAKALIQGVEYDLDVNNFTNREAMDIEKVTGLTFGEFGEQLGRTSAHAFTALVWIMQRRDNPQLKFSEVTFLLGDVDIVPDEEDAAAETEAKSDPSEPVSDEASDN